MALSLGNLEIYIGPAEFMRLEVDGKPVWIGTKFDWSRKLATPHMDNDQPPDRRLAKCIEDLTPCA